MGGKAVLRTADRSQKCLFLSRNGLVSSLIKLLFCLEPKQCLVPAADGKGYWIPEDKTFGLGLNIHRTRHASEIIKTIVRMVTPGACFKFNYYDDHFATKIVTTLGILLT